MIHTDGKRTVANAPTRPAAPKVPVIDALYAGVVAYLDARNAGASESAATLAGRAAETRRAGR